MRTQGASGSDSPSTRGTGLLLLVALVLVAMAAVLIQSVVRSQVPSEMATACLIEAAQLGDLAAIDAALASGACVDAADEQGCTPLITAARAGHRRVVEHLLLRGADVRPRARGSLGTALAQAAMKNDVEIAEVLLAAGADPNARAEDGGTPLWSAALSVEAGTQIVERLLRTRADPNIAASDGSTPLMKAAEEGKPQAVRLLLGAGANVDAVADDGNTALSLARSRGKTEIIRLLERAATERTSPGTAREPQ